MSGILLDETICNERHKRIDSTMERIEKKVDKLLWKLLALMVALITLLIAGIRFVK
jgi:predicted nucleic acid-binding Zn ribbon protein